MRMLSLHLDVDRDEVSDGDTKTLDNFEAS